jgi:hypothetical protein
MSVPLPDSFLHGLDDSVLVDLPTAAEPADRCDGLAARRVDRGEVNEVELGSREDYPQLRDRFVGWLLILRRLSATEDRKEHGA